MTLAGIAYGVWMIVLIAFGCILLAPFAVIVAYLVGALAVGAFAVCAGIIMAACVLIHEWWTGLPYKWPKIPRKGR